MSEFVFNVSPTAKVIWRQSGLTGPAYDILIPRHLLEVFVQICFAQKPPINA